MPVASFTDWIDVKIGSTVQPMLSAKLQVMLAIGTPDQLTAFRTSRNITVPASTTSKNENPITKKANPTALANMLSTFIDNLALSLPKRPEADQQYSTDSQYQLRRTSDLLDVLHNALKNPAPANLITSASALPLKLSEKVDHLPTNNQQKSIEENIRVTIHIDSARNLISEEKAQDCYSSDPQNFENENPSTYVSFEAIECDKEGHYSNFATKIAPYSCNEIHWNEKFNVLLPMDLLQQVSIITLEVRVKLTNY